MPSQQPARPLYAKQTAQLFFQATVRHRLLTLQALTLPISNVLLGVCMPFFASKVLAGIVARGPWLWQDFVWLCGITVAGFALNMYGIRRCMALHAKVTSELHNRMFSQLLQRSVGFYTNNIGGKLVSDALDFVGAYGQLFGAVFINLLGFMATIVVGLAIVFVNSWIIGLCLVTLFSLLLVWTVHESRRRGSLRAKRLELGKQLTAHVSDNIVNAVTVKMFAKEDSEIARNNQLNDRLEIARVTDWQRTVTNETWRMGVLLLAQIVLLLVLIQLTAHDKQLLATGIFAFTYTLTIINRFFSINTLTKQMDDAFLQASPMTELLGTPIELEDAPNAQPLTIMEGGIVLKDVAFRYADADQAAHVFKRLNLTIRPGEKIGLVGRSGGGKSTLTRLLLRFDDVTAGTITVDGQDIRNVTQTSLREQIAYVPQEPLLFHRSIHDNIAYGLTTATAAEVENAARLAYAHEFITKLPQGYDTLVGERGVKLSGGQRQRIAIARAMLKNAPILVLDEATSALDSESEKLIQQALWELMDDKTAVVIAHRLSTIQKMDRIVVLDKGKIVEQGSHRELLDAGGTYAKLWAHQSGGFIEE